MLDFIPISEELLAEENLEKCKLPDFAYGVDGCHFVFQEAPRKCPI